MVTYRRLVVVRLQVRTQVVLRKAGSLEQLSNLSCEVARCDERSSRKESNVKKLSRAEPTMTSANQMNDHNLF